MDLSLLITILCGMLFMLAVMLAIIGLMLHHRKGMKRIKTEVNEIKFNHNQQRRSTKSKNPAKVDDDGYIMPKKASLKPCGLKSPNLRDGSPDYLNVDQKPYQNIHCGLDGSDSEHLYEAMSHI